MIEVGVVRRLRWHRCIGMRRVIGHGATSLLVGLDEVVFQGQVYKNGCGFR